MQAITVKNYELLSKGWMTEAGEIDARRYRAELALVFPPIGLLFVHTKTALWIKPTRQRAGDSLCHHTTAPKQHTAVSSADERLLLTPVVKHTAQGWALSVKKGIVLLLNQSRRSRPSWSTSFNWQLALSGLLEGNAWAFFRRWFTPKAASPKARGIRSHQQSSSSLCCTLKQPKQAWSPQTLQGSLTLHPPPVCCSKHTTLGGLWHTLFQSVWPEAPIHTHIRNGNYVPGSQGQILTLQKTQSPPSIFQNFMVIPLCRSFMHSWNLFSLWLKIATNEKNPAVWNFCQRVNSSPGVICATRCFKACGSGLGCLWLGELVRWELPGHSVPPACNPYAEMGDTHPFFPEPFSVMDHSVESFYFN